MEEAKNAELLLFLYVKPERFSGINSKEIQFDKRFADWGIFLKSEMSINTGEISVLDFYRSLEYVKNKEKQKPRPHGRKSH